MTNSISIFQNKNKHKLCGVWMKLDKSTWPWPMSGSCHFNRASYKKFSVKFWIFVSVMFFTRGQVLKFGTPSSSRVFKGALTQKGQFWVNWTSFRPDFNVGWNKIKTNIQNLALNWSFDALSGICCTKSYSRTQIVEMQFAELKNTPKQKYLILW